MSEAEIYSYLVLPAAIFFARIADVSVGTLRIIFISRRHPAWATLLGFVEVLIWLTAMTVVFKNLTNWACFAAFAGGYAAGNYIGIMIEEWLAVGLVMVRIVPIDGGGRLCQHLREEGIGVTVADGEGARGPVKMIFAVVKRRDLRRVLDAIKHYNPKAFFTISDVRTAMRGNFPVPARSVLGAPRPAKTGPIG